MDPSTIEKEYSKFKYAITDHYLTPEEKYEDMKNCVETDIKVFWVNNKGFNRAKGPALIKFKDGNISEVYWYKNNKLHRQSGIAVTKFNKEGAIICVKYYNEGKEHSINDIPSTTEYYDNGNKKLEMWCKNGKIYRYDNENNKKPYYIEYDENGNKRELYEVGYKNHEELYTVEYSPGIKREVYTCCYNFVRYVDIPIMI